MNAASAPGTVVRLPDARDAGGGGLADLLEAIRAVGDEDGFDELADDAVDDLAVDDDELAAQDLALAGESASLRARAEQYARAVASGAEVDAEDIDALLCAFRSYAPFLDGRDRALNEAAYRRLREVTPARRAA